MGQNNRAELFCLFKQVPILVSASVIHHDDSLDSRFLQRLQQADHFFIRFISRYNDRYPFFHCVLHSNVFLALFLCTLTLVLSNAV